MHANIVTALNRKVMARQVSLAAAPQTGYPNGRTIQLSEIVNEPVARLIGISLHKYFLKPRQHFMPQMDRSVNLQNY